MSSSSSSWRRCQEVKTGKYFWMNTKTNEIRYTKPSSLKRHISRPHPQSPSTQRRNSIDRMKSNGNSNGNSNNTRHVPISHRRTHSKDSNNSDNGGNSPKSSLSSSQPPSYHRSSKLEKQTSSTPPPPNHNLSALSSVITSKISSGHVPSSDISSKTSPPKKPKTSWWGGFGKKNKDKNQNRRHKTRSKTVDFSSKKSPPKPGPSFTKSQSEEKPTMKSALPAYEIIEDHFNDNNNTKRRPKVKNKKKDKSKSRRATVSSSKHSKPAKPAKPAKHYHQQQSLNAIYGLNEVSSRMSVSRMPSTNGGKREKSKYDIDPDADIQKILHDLLGYDMLDLDESMDKNIYIKSNIDSILSYRYQSLSLSHIKQFNPPLNDKLAEIKYFRNIQYPQYPLDTNLKITQIINQNIYDGQTPYLRVRIPLNIIRDIFGNQTLLNKKQSVKLMKMGHNIGSDQNDESKTNETFNIELSNNDKDILSTTVQQFFHSITKQTSGIKEDTVIEHMFMSKDSARLKSPSPSMGSPQTSLSPDLSPLCEQTSQEYVSSMHLDQYDWSKLAIKAAGMEEYIFYSTDERDKICNYECVRYALSHQLDKDDNQCFLTLVYLEEFDEKIAKLKQDYIAYEQYINLWRSNVRNICDTKQQFKNVYPWLNVINEQFNKYPRLPQVSMDENGAESKEMEKRKSFSDIDYIKMNDPIHEWKEMYDQKVSDNNIILLQQYECLFEYTIHAITNAIKLPRYDRDKYKNIVISFELQIGSLSYEQDIWLTPPKPNSNKIEFNKKIYKSKHLRINTFPREIILSVIVFGVPKTTSDADIYSTVYSAKSANIPSWFPSKSDSSNGSRLSLGIDFDDNSNGNGNGYYSSNVSSGNNSKSSSPHLLLKEDPIDLRFNPSYNNLLSDQLNDEQKTPSMGTPTTRRRQYSYGSASDKDGNNINFHVDNHDDNRDYKGVFHRAFHKCDALAYLRIPLIDEFHQYRQGTFTFNLWDIPKWHKSKHEPRDPYGHDLLWRFIKPSSFPPVQHTTSNAAHQCQITITIGPNPENNPDYSPPIAIAPLFNHIMKPSKMYEQIVTKPREKFSAKEYKKMDAIVRRDPLTKLTKKERLLIWVSREKLSKTKPRALPVFLSCVDWRNPYYRSEAYKYLYKWKLPNLLSDLIELLAQWKFPDNRIKHFVITQAFSKLSDIQIKHILLQLVQIIKLDPHNVSFTSNFLIQRALRSVTRIGHYLFWYLKTGMMMIMIYIFTSLIYIKNCNLHHALFA